MLLEPQSGRPVFKDHFSGHAAEYAKFRPVYPDEMFDWLARQAPDRARAVDVATGNGQAAVALASRFASVIALDASAAQLDNATPHERGGVPGRASRIDGPPRCLRRSRDGGAGAPLARSCGLLRRSLSMLRPGGLFAAWGYSNATIAPGVRSRHSSTSTLGSSASYWPPERAIVEARYEPVVLPFEEIAPPAFALEQEMTGDGFAGYIGTWSAVQRYRQAVGSDPLPFIRPAIDRYWPTPDTIRLVRWPLFLRVGRNPA